MVFRLIDARCEQDPDVDVVELADGGDLGIVGEDAQDFGDGSFSPAPGMETVCVFPKNPSKCEFHYRAFHALLNQL